MIGYVLYALLLIMPGLAVGLATGLLERKRFVEVLALGFGLSLVVTPIALLLAYSAVHAVTWEVVYTILAVSLFAVVLLAWRQGVKVGRPSINLLESVALALVPIQGALLSLQFLEYPIFPETISEDYRAHLQTALSLNSGQLPLSQISYPPAIHFLIASLISVEGGILISVMQYAIVIIATLAPLLVFVVVSRILGDQMLGLVASLIYVFTGAAWVSMILVTGLYANFLANLVTLAVIYLAAEGTEALDWRKRFVILGGGAALYLSHYTVLVFVAVLWLALPVVWWKARASLSRYLQVAGLITLPGILIALARPDLLTEVLAIPGLSGMNAGVIGSLPDPIAALLAPFSTFLAYLESEVGVGLFFLALAALPVALYASVKKQGIWVPIILIWFAVTWFATPAGTIAWRFSVLGVLPLIVLWPVALQTVLPRARARAGGREIIRRKKIRDYSQSNARWLVAVLVAIVLLYHAPLSGTLQDLAVGREASAQNQEQVYSAILWLGTHSTPGAQVLGLEDWRFSYLIPIWGDSVTLYANASVSEAVNLVNRSSYGYLIVSNYLVPGPFSTIEGINSNFQGFQNSSRFILIYSNPSVAVYSVRNGIS